MSEQYERTSLIHALHQHAPRAVLAITGGGAEAIARLLAVPGSSRWLLEATVPYSAAAVNDFLGREPERACCVATSQALAARALDRARWLAPDDPVLGLGATASLVSDRPKRGDHRIHVSVRLHGEERTWSLVLVKGARDRKAEEALAADLILHALAHAVEVTDVPPLPLLDGECIDTHHKPAISLPAAQDVLHLTVDARLTAERAPAGLAILCGAFNPLHRGHWAMAAAAQAWLGKPIAFELSIANVDKPELSAAEVRRRLEQFAGRAEVWLTRAPRFAEKARLFPQATFIAGADTALRIVDPSYYGDLAKRDAALTFLRTQGCCFLVACRDDGTGRCLTLADIALPEAFSDLFFSLPPERFRLDVTSTALRGRI